MSKLISKIVVPDSTSGTGYSLYNVKDSDAVHSSDVGVASGVASLDSAGKVPSSQLPSYVDDVVEGYYHENKFYTTYTPGQEEEDPGIYSGEITAETGKIYVDIPTNQSYRWSGSAYIVISSPYVLPTASANTLGGVKVGNNLSIDPDGTLSAPDPDSKTNAENGNGIGTCSTSSGTALTVSLTDYELVLNGFVAVTFENDVPANATLNVNGKGAKPIIYKGAAIEADIIKADDTVMFAYDGTNYVVTSLGGGGGTIVWPDFVNIHLGSTRDTYDKSLIGATVVVTNDDTSDIILSTTWQGENISLNIDAGISYTITAGNSVNYVTPSAKSFTSTGVSRVVTFVYVADLVDLGLPSGTLWCTHNVGANNPVEPGYFFSWGNTMGHNLNALSTEYDFNSTNYSTTPGSSLSANISPGDPRYDAVAANMGSPFRIPTISEYTELRDNCNWTTETISNVACLVGTSKNNNNRIIFPRCGYFSSDTQQRKNSWILSISNQYVSANNHAYFRVNGASIVCPDNTGVRSDGLTARGVV